MTMSQIINISAITLIMLCNIKRILTMLRELFECLMLRNEF